jgi:two-component system, OmpR family, sensor histidine kinase KdpD
MFDEARRRRERGQDVVVGAVQRVIPPQIEDILKNLDVVPMKNGIEMNVDALVRRHPAICVIDGLAYNNPPGALNAARWLDVQDLLAVGIKVIGSINVQYIDELREQVESITGKRVTESVPVSFIKSADEIEIVDAPGEVPSDRLPDEMAEFVARQRRLSGLRELALVLAADLVDHQLEDYLERHGIRYHPGARERIMICITPRANAWEMVETGRVMADRFHGELIAAYVSQPEITPAAQAALDDKLALARAAGAQIEMLDGEDPVDTILNYAKARGVTQLFIGHSGRTGLGARLWGNPVEKLIQRSQGMDVRVFPQ